MLDIFFGRGEDGGRNRRTAINQRYASDWELGSRHPRRTNRRVPTVLLEDVGEEF